VAQRRYLDDSTGGWLRYETRTSDLRAHEFPGQRNGPSIRDRHVLSCPETVAESVRRVTFVNPLADQNAQSLVSSIANGNWLIGALKPSDDCDNRASADVAAWHLPLLWYWVSVSPTKVRRRPEARLTDVPVNVFVNL
jgi:hypothetical protein